MKASELIVQVNAREFERLTAWVAQYLGAQEAEDLARYAVVEMWTGAARGDNTRNGPIADMIGSLTMRVRRLREIRSTYLPVAAPLTVRAPSDTELNELADAYSLVYVTALRYDLDWTIRRDIQAWLHLHLDRFELSRYEGHMADSVRRGAAAIRVGAEVLDSGVVVAGDAYRWRDTCRQRELARSRRWLISVTAHQRGAGYGTVEQDGDPGVPRQDAPDDQLPGAR